MMNRGFRSCAAALAVGLVVSACSGVAEGDADSESTEAEADDNASAGSETAETADVPSGIDGPYAQVAECTARNLVVSEIYGGLAHDAQNANPSLASGFRLNAERHHSIAQRSNNRLTELGNAPELDRSEDQLMANLGVFVDSERERFATIVQSLPRTSERIIEIVRNAERLADRASQCAREIGELG